MPDDELDWTIVTVTFNSSSDLRRYWSRSDLPRGTWVVVDNGSVDDSVEVAESLGATVIKAERNGGFSFGNNLGLSLTSSSYVGFVNPDAFATIDQLKTLQGHIDKHGGLCAPQLTYPNGDVQPNGRDLPTIWAKVLHRLAPASGNYRILADSPCRTAVAWAMGAAVFGSRGDFERIGGWNEAYFIYYEDADLGLTAWDAGIAFTLCGATRMVHGWDRATTRPSVSAWRLEALAALAFYRRHPSMLLPRWVHIVTRRKTLRFLQHSRVPCGHR